MRLGKRLIIWFVCFLLAVGHVYAGGDIELKAIKNVTYQEFKDNVLTITAVVTVNNPNWGRVKIKKANLDLCLNDQPVGRVTQVEPIVLKGKTETDYPLRVAIEMQSLTSNLPALFRMLMNDTKQLNLSGSMMVRSLLHSKTYKVDRLMFR